MMKSFQMIQRSQNFFSSIVKNLNIQRDEKHRSKTTQDNSVFACIEKFSEHPSIISINKRMETDCNKFSCKYGETKKFLTEIQNLNSRKASQQNDYDRLQRVKINSSFTHWSNVGSGIPQGSIKGPLLFNIYIRTYSTHSLTLQNSTSLIMQMIPHFMLLI